MMRDTIRSDVAALGYKMLYTRAKSHTSGGAVMGSVSKAACGVSSATC